MFLHRLAYLMLSCELWNRIDTVQQCVNCCYGSVALLNCCLDKNPIILILLILTTLSQSVTFLYFISLTFNYMSKIELLQISLNTLQWRYAGN